MKKIAIFTPSLNIGGVEKVLLTYAELLTANGAYEVVYLVCHMDGKLRVSPNVKLINLNTKRLRQSLYGVISFLRKEKPHYLLVANTVTILALLAKWISFVNVRVVSSHHYYPSVETRSFLDRWLIFKIYNWCYKVIAISNGIYDLLREKGVKTHKLELIYNPLNIDNIIRQSLDKVNRPNIPYILYVGRMAKVKNLKLLIDAVERLNYKMTIPLVIVGEGPEQNDLENYVDNGKIKNVYFMGAVSNPYPYIRNAKVVALSSSSEAFPTILLESLALGRTIVSTPTKGAIEILRNGQFGYLSKTFDLVSDYAQTLEYALNNPIDSTKLCDYVLDVFSASKTLERIDEIL